VGNARNIAEKFVADKVDLIAPCTTPNSQATVQVAKDSGIPVVFGCVTNPVAAGILESVDKPSGSNVTGMYNPIPIPELFDLFLKIDPNMKKVGTIYNASEDNSVLINKQAKAEAEKRGLEWIEVTVASSADVKTAAESLIGKIDAYIIGQDNTVASALEAVVKTAVDNGLPIFAMDPQAVERGAVASLAANQYDSGLQWAKELAVPVLLGTDPGTLTPVKPKSFDLQVNLDAAKAANLTIPPDVIEKANKVFGQP
jgi:putative ABC transport system substrate-binding protein